MLNKVNNHINWKLIVLIAIISSGIIVTTLFNQSIRLDESQSIWFVTRSLSGVIKIVSEDVHVPLYEIILHYWIQIWGTGILATRLLSLIFFLLTLPVLYKMAQEASDNKVAGLTIGLFAFSPFMMWYASEGRMYSMFVLMACLSHLFFTRIIRSKGRKGKLGYFISSLLGIYTHYFFIFLLFSQGVYVVARMVMGKKRLGQEVVIYILGIIFMVGILFLPWLYLMIISGAAANSQPLISRPTSFNLIQTFVNFFFGFQGQIIQAVLISLWPLLVVAIFLVFTQDKKIRIRQAEYYVLVSFLPIFVTFFISYFKPLFLSRYLIFTTPSLFFILAWIIINYSVRISSILSVVLLSFLLVLGWYQNISDKTPVKEDYRQVVNYLERVTSDRDKVVVTAPFTIYPIEYQYNGPLRIETIPQWDRYTTGAIPVFSQSKLVDQVNSYKNVYQKLYVVFSYDQGYQKQIQDYLDKNFELLDDKKFSNQIELRVYKLRYDLDMTPTPSLSPAPSPTIILIKPKAKPTVIK